MVIVEIFRQLFTDNKYLKIFFASILLFVTARDSYAARNFTIQNLAGNPVNYYMRDTIDMTIRVTNTNTNPNTGDSIMRVRFTFPTSMAVNNTGHVAPSGWSIAVNIGNNRVTFTSNDPSYNISTGNYKDFTIRLTVGTSNIDSTLEYISNVRCTYVSNSFVNVNNPSSVSWYRRGLKIVSMVASPELITSGDSFSLTITVQNVSSAAQNNITANPNPPARTIVGTVNPNTSSNPSIASLAVLATGTLVYSYTTGTNDEGTVYFTCNVRNGANNTTGISSSSNTVYVGRFTAEISFAPSCPLSGETVTVTLTVINRNAFALSNVVPNLNYSGTATLNYVSGPTPASIASLPANGGTGTFTYNYTVSGGYDATIIFTGSASGQKTTPPPGTRLTPITSSNTGYIRSYALNLGPTPIYAKSKNIYLNLVLENKANLSCSADTNYDIKNLEITIPSGFSYVIGESSYLIGNDITDTNNNDFEYYSSGWTVSDASNPIIFTSSGVTYNLKQWKYAHFSLLFNELPNINIDTPFTFQVKILNHANNLYTYNIPITLTTTPTGKTLKPRYTKGGMKERIE